MGSGRVVSIHVTPDQGGELATRPEVQLDAGRGVRGNRQYGDGLSPKAQLTLVAVEDVAAVNAATGLTLRAELMRRNVVTEGVDLLSLVGRRFRVGDAVAEGIEHCRPCGYMTTRLEREGHTGDLSADEVLASMDGRGGLRAAILESGVLRVGDAVEGVAVDADGGR